MSKVRVQVLFDIRDARGLNEHEKMFLHTVELRGTMKTTWEKAAADMGFRSRKAFYNARNSLKAKGLLAVMPTEGVTHYWVNAEILKDFLRDSPVENCSPMGNGDSPEENRDSPEENRDSPMGQQKGTGRRKEEDQEDSGGGEALRDRVWQEIAPRYWSVESKKPVGERMSIQAYIDAHLHKAVS